MAKNSQLSNLTVNAECNALAELLNGGFIDLMDGPQPDAADLPITTQTLGVTLTFGDPAFRPAVAGVLVSNPIQPGVAVANVAPTWARMYKADHKTAVLDISVGTEDANLIIPVPNLEKGVTLSASYSHVIAKSAAGS